MSEPYLILHKVRGEPAFDIAERLIVTPPNYDGVGAEEWWIIPTSGHRAYPVWTQPLGEILQGDVFRGVIDKTLPFHIPDDIPDHYKASESPPPRQPRPTKPTTTEDFLV